MKKIKISQLPQADSVEGLFTIGTDAANRSVKVPLDEVGSNIKGAPTDAVLEDIEPNIAINALRKTAQQLTEEEQAQVKTNLGISKTELFCDIFNQMAGSSGYARLTDGKFDCELNKVKLTYDEAIATYAAATTTPNFFIQDTNKQAFSWSMYGVHIRTNINPYAACTYMMCHGYGASCDTFCVNNNPSPYALLAGSSLPNCITLMGKLLISQATAAGLFVYVTDLENAMLHLDVATQPGGYTLNLRSCSKINKATAAYMVENAKDSENPRTIAVHPDVFAKLTDEANTEWHKVFTDAQAKNISFVS